MKWIFPSNNNAGITGINNAGVATFANTLYESLVRESIQNSLDAKLDSYDGPVEVHFEQLKIPTDNIPGKASLDEALVKCTEVKSNNDKTTEFFSKAHSTLNRSEIYVLKVSDYHTIGLKGSSTGEMGSSWSRLVKESGTNNKAGDAGGSFGIGKSAYFACSRLRTVFFSSLSEDDEKSNIGVSWLITFDIDENTKSMGTGYYTMDEKCLAIPELADFDGKPLRTETGTDVYIIGNFIPDTGIQGKLIEAVIANFMVSILKGMLIVKIGEIVIDADYVDRYFKDKFNRDRKTLSKETVSLLDYYRIIKCYDADTLHIKLDSEVYGKEFGFADGECELYLKKGTDLNRKILVTRKTGMRLFEQTGISGSIIFSGVLYVSGANMNRLFRDMEGPAHNKWAPNEQADNYQEQKDAYGKLRDYLRKQVTDNFEDKVGDEFDAFDVGDFLPDVLAETDDGTGSVELTLQDKKVKVRSKVVKPTKKKRKDLDPIKELEQEEAGITTIAGEKTGTGDGPGIGTVEGGGTGGGTGTGTGDDPGTGTKPGDGDSTLDDNTGNGNDTKSDQPKYKENENVSRRTICRDPKAGIYTVSVNIPNKAKHAKLCISIAAEQSDYKLDVLNASFARGYVGDTVITGVNGNEVYLENLDKNENLKLDLTVGFKGYCMMEVDYYESKK